MTMILNLTKHRATPEQIAAGVVDLSDADRKELSELLTFSSIPIVQTLIDRADRVAMMAVRIFIGTDSSRCAMIGGAPYFMRPLEDALRDADINPIYAFSVRESVERALPDGTVEKTAVFRHAGFVGMEKMS